MESVLGVKSKHMLKNYQQQVWYSYFITRLSQYYSALCTAF